MADEINFLGTQKPAPGKGPAKGNSADDLGMHVPAAETPAPKLAAPLHPPAPTAPPVRHAPIPELFSGSRVPSAPATPPTSMPAALPPSAKASGGMPPPPRPPSAKASGGMPPPPPPPKYTTPVNPPKRDDGTLRVSLISTGSGTSLSELAIKSRMRGFLMVLGVALFVVVATYGGLLFYKSRVIARNALAEENVRGLDAKIAAAETAVLPARNLQVILNSADEALKKHIHWSNFLEVIEDIAHPKVQFVGIGATIQGTFTTGVNAPDYLTLAQQLVSLRIDPRVKSATMGAVTANVDESGLAAGVSSALDIQIDPAVFGYKPAGVPAMESAASATTTNP